MLIQKRLRGHDHAIDAVAALGGLFVDERLLQRTWLLHAAQVLERGDLVALGGGGRKHARMHSRAVQVDGAGTAFGKTAPELGPVQPQLVTQHIEQHRAGLGLDCVLLTVYLEVDCLGHDALPRNGRGSQWKNITLHVKPWLLGLLKEARLKTATLLVPGTTDN